MNVERLHSIASAVRDDLRDLQIPSLLGQLRDSLQNQASNPQEASYPQQVAQFRQRLEEALAASVVGTFPAAWTDVVRDLGWYDLLGAHLLDQVEDSFAGNDLTPSIAGERIGRLAGQVAELYAQLDSLVNALDHFNLGEEDLTSDEAEITVLIPREAVDGDLAPLGIELQKLDQILGPFQEVITGSRPPIVVRSISSSQFTIYLAATPLWGLAFARAVSQILTIYQQVLDIRKSRTELENAGIKAETLAEIDEQAANRMKEAIEPMVEDILQRAVDANAERVNELRTDLRYALNAIANRIDKGYSLDVRMGEPDDVDEPDIEDEEGDGGEAGPSEVEVWQEMQTLSSRLRFAAWAGKPILHLPESTDDGDGQPANDAA